MKRVNGLLYLIVLSIFSLFSCNTPKGDLHLNEEEGHLDENEIILSKDQISEMKISLISIDSIVFYDLIQTTGRVEVPPQYNAKVSTFFEGFVKLIFPYAGEFVQKGQKLFVIENPKFLEVQRDYLESKALLHMIETDFTRQSSLREDNVTSQKNFAKSEAEFEVAKARYKSLKKTLEIMGINTDLVSPDNMSTEIVVRAPISGNINKIDISIGAYLHTSDIALEIVNLDHPHIELVVLEKDLSLIKEQQEIFFQLQNGRSKTYEAEVHLVNRTIDEESRTASVHGHLKSPEDSKEMSSGMYVEANILTDRRYVLAIAEESIVELNGRFFVLQLQLERGEEKHFTAKEIQKGKSFEGRVEVLNSKDFPKGSSFIGKGAFSLLSDGLSSGHSH